MMNMMHWWMGGSSAHEGTPDAESTTQIDEDEDSPDAAEEVEEAEATQEVEEAVREAPKHGENIAILDLVRPQDSRRGSKTR